MLRVLADLRPMGTVGPVPLTEVRDVLADRLRSLEVDPPANRYGRVFVGSPHQARGRSFKVVFVPGLAERLFPQKLREDPLLLDELRHRLARRPHRTSPIAPTSNACCCAWPSGAAAERALHLLSAHRNLRSACARAVVLRARNHARGHRPRARSPDARADGGAGVAREPCVAGAGRCGGCHRRPRARPLGASAVDAEQRRRQRACALHAHAERLSQALGHRAVGAGGEAMVAVRRSRARHRCHACVPADAAARQRARIPCRRFRNTPRVRINSFCPPHIASRRSKSRSRSSGWIR